MTLCNAIYLRINLETINNLCYKITSTLPPIDVLCKGLRQKLPLHLHYLPCLCNCKTKQIPSIKKCVIIAHIFYINVQKSKDFNPQEKRERKIGKYEGLHADWQKERSDNKKILRKLPGRDQLVFYINVQKSKDFNPQEKRERKIGKSVCVH